MTAEVRAVLALGANLGERAATLAAAVRDLDQVDGVHVVAVSPLVRSVAVRLDGPDAAAPEYLNGVAIVETALSARELLRAVNAIEAAHGRVRAERWGDRTLDIDIVTYGDEESDDPELTLPHPRAAERAFVLVPWLAIDADAVLPGAGRVDCLSAAHTADVRAWHPESAA